MTDLSTTYMGLPLKNPLVCSSSPLCREIGSLREMEDAGAAAVVLHSLFEEQIELESLDLHTYLENGAGAYGESLSYLPELETYNLGPEGYLDHVRRAKEALGIPVVASLNAASPGGWVRHARLIQEAGADALEVNVYTIPTDKKIPPGVVERQLIEIVAGVAGTVDIPVAVKLSPFYTAPAWLATELSAAGARGLALFNRFYQPDFDVQELDIVPRLRLSSSAELLLRLHWVAILHGEVDLDLAVTGGVHGHTDVVKCLLAGASAAMMTSALLANGVGYMSGVLRLLADWLAEREYESVAQMRGSMSMRRVADPAAFERVNYLHVLRSYALEPSRARNGRA